MHCREFREHHGDWVDDVVDPTLGDRLASHLAECAICARFDTLARRALLVARNAPQIEVSADFSSRLAARIADERRQRIASHAPSHVERRRVPRLSDGGVTWMRRAAVLTVLLGGSALLRGNLAGAGEQGVGYTGMGLAPALGGDTFPFIPAAAPAPGSDGDIVVVRSMRAEGGSLLPLSDDPLLDGENNASLGEVHATSVAATAPLWPTALMAAHAAHRFAAMEFGDVTPVVMTQVHR